MSTETEKLKSLLATFIDGKESDESILASPSVKEMREEVSNISKMDKLMFYWGGSESNSEEERIVEIQMDDVLKTNSNVCELMFYLENSGLSPKLKKLFETRIIVISKTISDIYRLMFFLDCTDRGSNLGKIFMIRMIKVLKDISSKNIPDWFEKMLGRPGTIPEFVEEDFRKKAKELLDALS